MYCMYCRFMTSNWGRTMTAKSYFNTLLLKSFIILINSFNVVSAENLTAETPIHFDIPWSETLVISDECLNPNELTMKIYDNFLHLVWYDERLTYVHRNIYYAKSNFFGYFWENDYSLTKNNVSVYNWPTIDVQDNFVHVAYTKFPGVLFYIRSKDYGKSWEVPIRLSYEGWVFSPSIVVVNNIVHLVYEDNEILYTHSKDNGINWSATKRISPPKNYYKYGSAVMAVDKNNIHIIYIGSTRIPLWRTSLLYYQKSSDNGKTFTTPIKLADGAIATKLGMAIDNNFIHIVYNKPGVDGDYKIFYVRSIDCGATWEAEKLLYSAAPGRQARYPNIAAKNNTVHVVWYAGYSDEFEDLEIFYKYSRDAGSSWSENIRITHDADDSFDPTVTCDNDNVYIAWATCNFTESWNYIYFKRSLYYCDEIKSTKPKVNITYPKARVIVDGVVNVTGVAVAIQPNTTIQKVYIQIGYNLVNKWVEANGTNNWYYLWNTTKEIEGPTHITVCAFDGCNYSNLRVILVYVRGYGRGGVIVYPLPELLVCVYIAAILVTVVFWRFVFKSNFEK